jgi:hypothetical protein
MHWFYRKFSYWYISHSSIPDNVVKNISEGDEIFSFFLLLNTILPLTTCTNGKLRSRVSFRENNVKVDRSLLNKKFWLKISTPTSFVSGTAILNYQVRCHMLNQSIFMFWWRYAHICVFYFKIEAWLHNLVRNLLGLIFSIKTSYLAEIGQLWHYTLLDNSKWQNHFWPERKNFVTFRDIFDNIIRNRRVRNISIRKLAVKSMHSCSFATLKLFIVTFYNVVKNISEGNEIFSFRSKVVLPFWIIK